MPFVGVQFELEQRVIDFRWLAFFVSNQCVWERSNRFEGPILSALRRATQPQSTRGSKLGNHRRNDGSFKQDVLSTGDR